MPTLFLYLYTLFMKFPKILFFIFLVACGTSDKNESTISQPEYNSLITNANWRFSFQIKDEEIPFNVVFENIGKEDQAAIIKNGKEEILCKNLEITEDSIFITIPVYNTVLAGRIESENLITGNWINTLREDYFIPFIAEKGKTFRFTPAKTGTVIPNKYHAFFQPDSDENWDAILNIEQTPEGVTGTFLTETGDYGYLQGNIIHDKLFLSSFEGSHAYLFKADIVGDALANGEFISGIHGHSNWYAAADSTFELKNPKTLTYLKEGYESFDFKLPNQDGDTVTWDDLNLENKVVIVDIMGSWCPNCLDASVAMNKILENYTESAIEIIPIAFERTDNLEEAKRRVFNFQNHFGHKNRFLFGGKVNSKNTAEAFPMLNHIMSFPTLIFIGKDREIKQIYTGFYGPGTGKYYEEFLVKTKTLLDELVAEE